MISKDVLFFSTGVVAPMYRVVFHLSGKIYEDIIDPTLDELVKLNARFIVPCHCTEWKAVNKIIQLVPDSFIQSSVGSKFLFFGCKIRR